MSLTDAIMELEQAAQRVDEEIAISEAREVGSMWRRMNLNAARRNIGSALATLKKDQRDA